MAQPDFFAMITMAEKQTDAKNFAVSIKSVSETAKFRVFHSLRVS